MRIYDEAVLIFVGEQSGSAPMASSICGLDRSARAIAAVSGAKKSPARAGLSLQEEPSNVTFTIDV